MKISEITDKNITWNNINGINIAEIQSTYKNLINALLTIVSLKSPNRSAIMLNNVHDFIELVNRILQSTYPDKDDPDIVMLKAELLDMKQHILNLSSQLTT